MTGALTRRIIGWTFVWGALTFLPHIPFVLRYDLFFTADMAVFYLQTKRLLLGEFPLYQWGSDYAGFGPVHVVTAAAARLFGDSIVLSGLVSLMFWAMGIGLLVSFIAESFGRASGIGAGCALAIGVPYFNKFATLPYGSTYNLTPLLTVGFIWLAILVLKKGPRSWPVALTAFLAGWTWYMHKQALLIFATVAAAIVLNPQGREFLRQFFRTRMAIIAPTAFLIGYSPEWMFRLGWISSPYLQKGDSAAFLKIASPETIAQNWYMLFRCLPAYFDADPWARAAEQGVHYLNHLENWESFPRSACDVFGVITAFLVVTYVIRSAINAYHDGDMPRLMLALCPLIAGMIIVISGQSNGSYYNIRRYFLPGGLCLVAWMGILLGKCWQDRKWAYCVVIGLTLAFSAIHQVRMLQYPDELADYRKIVGELEAHGLSAGATWYSYAHVLTALSNERVIFGILDRRSDSPYQQQVADRDIIALVWPAKIPPPFEFAQHLLFGSVVIHGRQAHTPPDRVAMFGHEYVRTGEPRILGELAWAPYRKAHRIAG